MFTVDVYRCIAMARRDAVVQPYQFDPELDPESQLCTDLVTEAVRREVVSTHTQT